MKTASFAVLLVGIVTQLASAGLQLDIQAIDSDTIKLTFSGSDNFLSGSMMHTLVASGRAQWSDFDVDFFHYTENNGFLSSTALTVDSNTLMFSSASGGSVAIDEIYFDDDPNGTYTGLFDDIGFSTMSNFSYNDGELMSVSGMMQLSGSVVVSGSPVGIASLFDYGVNTMAPASTTEQPFSNGPKLNVSAVPEPSSWILLSLITGLVVTRNGVKRLFARWFSK
ncbi:MAG: PEP-CTERM sorting domain-containing protein [Pirellulaceae bacterium]